MRGDRLRARWADGERDPSFLGLDHPNVQALVRELAPGSEVRELGGWTSTNVQLVDAGHVLRVHQRCVARDRLAAVHDVRRRLLARGLLVPEPLALLRCGDRVAELEEYVPHTAVADDLAPWEAVGTLHRASRDLTLPRPVDAQYGTPATLRRYLTELRGDEETMRVAQWALGIVRELRRQWVPASQLPTQLVHGDLVGPNDEGVASDFDWSRVPTLVATYEEASGERITELERRALGPYTAAVPLAVAHLPPTWPTAHTSATASARRACASRNGSSPTPSADLVLPMKILLSRSIIANRLAVKTR